ncbi:MAG: branched-chain amino acid ABC transporter permease [Pseudomonadota bacterium]
MIYFLEVLLNGAVVGSLYALIALAFVVVYKATRIINFALGEFVMFASSIVAVGLHVLGFGLLLSLGFGVIGMAAFAMVFNHLVMRHLLGHRLISLIMVTIGLGAFMRGLAVFLFIGVPKSIELPFSADAWDVGGMLISPHELSSAATAALCIAMVGWFFLKSRTGIALRSISDDQQAAMAMGINVPWHFAMTWALAGAIAVAGGALWTYVTGGGFSMVLVGLKVFPIVIIGGLDSIPGVIVGAMLIGILEAVAAAFLDPIVGGGMSSVTAYVVLIVALMVRPYGLFGRVDVERV